MGDFAKKGNFMYLQTYTIQDAITHLQAMPEPLRREAFHYIDFLRTRLDTPSPAEATAKPKKRQAGTAKGVAIFADDFDDCM